MNLIEFDPTLTCSLFVVDLLYG